MAAGMQITKAGRNLLAKALTGKELHFTRGFAGDGVLTSEIISDMTAMISPKRELPIQSIEIPEGVGVCEIILEMNNAELPQGFFLREYALFAQDPDTEEEILYSYRNVGDEASYLPGSVGPDTVQYTLSLKTIIDQAENVTAQITSNNSYVTNSRLEARIAALFGEAGDIDHFWTFQEGDVQKLRPATLQRVKDVVVGEYDFQNLNNRVEVLENALAQVLLEFENINLYPDYMNFIVENFNNTSQLDMFKTRVTGIITGDDSIDVEDINGMLPLSWYMISDGVNSELVQLKSINRENGLNRIILTEDIQNSYRTATTQIYRTSALIKTGRAEGSTTLKCFDWEANISWSGRNGNEAYEVPSQITANNYNLFTFTGQTNFTSSGYFCIADSSEAHVS